MLHMVGELKKNSPACAIFCAHSLAHLMALLFADAAKKSHRTFSQLNIASALSEQRDDLVCG